MSDFGNRPSLDTDQKRELFEELELVQTVDVHKLRTDAVTHVTADVVVRPGDICDRGRVVGTGKAREFQNLGVTCVLDLPALPGSLFQLAFTATDFELEPLLAVCERCAMLNEGAFETHFRFMQHVELTPSEGQAG